MSLGSRNAPRTSWAVRKCCEFAVGNQEKTAHVNFDPGVSCHQTCGSFLWIPVGRVTVCAARDTLGSTVGNSEPQGLSWLATG